MDTLQKMKMFVKVVEGGSFTAAANQLNSTTSMMSRALSELEAHLQTRLLHRTTRKIRLTDAGERYFAACQAILGAIENAENAASGAHERPEGLIRLHSTPGFGARYLIKAIAQYRQRFPKVNFDLVLSHRLPDMLEDGVDVSFQMGQKLPDSAFISRRLGRVFSILCASPGYIQSAGEPAQVADLHAFSCLKLTAPFFDDAFWTLSDGSQEESFPLTASPALEINHADALILALEEDLGIGPLPSYNAAQALQSGAVVRVLPRHTLRELNVFAVYPSKKYLDAKIRTWVDFMQETLPAALSRDEEVIAGYSRANSAPDVSST